ncbi:SgcJ/EcaC family oxidoreductase [Inquilinus sp. NPDC058860]|uniref:SgcJ/EcaC family oxidoreductase n=1 Tax=Inquilinus sp. NPDC058860 TaxID=3346652 RepID=UPI0036B0A757
MRFALAGALALSLLSLQSAFAAQPAAAAQSAAEATRCEPITEAEVAGLFDRWNASLATLKAEAVAANYAEDAILLPTLSNTPRLTREQRIEYFKHFLEQRPQGVVDSRVIRIGCNKVTDAGTYTFTLADGSKVPARYTYTYEFADGAWLIASHHSSIMPEK